MRDLITRGGMRWLLGVALTCAATWMQPAMSAAQTTASASGVLYETLEAPPGEFQTNGARILPGAFIPTGERLAQATETGSVQGSGALEWMTGDMTVHAQSRVPVD